MQTTKNPTPISAYRPGVLVMIEQRLCSDKVQPDVQPGQVYSVIEAGTTRSGALRLTAQRDGIPQSRPRQLNAERFVLRIVSRERLQRAQQRVTQTLTDGMHKALEQAEAQKLDKNARRIAARLTDYEACQLAVVPLVIAEMAWYYAEEVCQEAARLRIPELKQLCRAVRKLRSDALNAGNGYAGSMHAIVKMSEMFIASAEVRKVCQPLYYALRNEFTRQFPDAPYTDLRIMAEMALFFIAAERKHLKWLVGKIPDIGRPQNEILEDKLWACMDAVRGNYVIGPTVHTENSHRIFANLIRGIHMERNEAGDFQCECVPGVCNE